MKIAKALLQKFNSTEEVKDYELIEIVLRNIKEQDFMLKKNYTIIKGVHSPYGKWPSVFGNVLLIDSNYFLEDLAGMVKHNFEVFFHNNDYHPE